MCWRPVCSRDNPKDHKGAPDQLIRGAFVVQAPLGEGSARVRKTARHNDTHLYCQYKAAEIISLVFCQPACLCWGSPPPSQV